VISEIFLLSRKYNKFYKLRNKKIINEKIRIRKQHDVNFNLLLKIRSRISSALKSKNNYKFNPTLKLLGCSVAFLKKHLEAQFKEGMTWKNHNLKGWHIDHIRPCSSFDLSKIKEQHKCFHYTNLQPLWATENLEKNGKITK
jgi:hypothetical protein